MKGEQVRAERHARQDHCRPRFFDRDQQQQEEQRGQQGLHDVMVRIAHHSGLEEMPRQRRDDSRRHQTGPGSENAFAQEKHHGHKQEAQGHWIPGCNPVDLALRRMTKSGDPGRQCCTVVEERGSRRIVRAVTAVGIDRHRPGEIGGEMLDRTRVIPRVGFDEIHVPLFENRGNGRRSQVERNAAKRGESKNDLQARQTAIIAGNAAAPLLVAQGRGRVDANGAARGNDTRKQRDGRQQH